MADDDGHQVFVLALRVWAGFWVNYDYDADNLNIFTGAVTAHRPLHNRVAWTTPIMAVLAFPLSHDIVDAFAALASQHGGMAEPSKWLRVIFSRFAILFMPFVFGTLGATVLTVNSIRNNWVANHVLLYAYMIAGGLLFAVFFAIYDGATSLMSGDKGRVGLVSLWLGWAWAVLYVSLGLQLYAFLVPALR